ncbi:fumarylacetoacetate hydrolase [halophilic archaeon]|nr:fumarylacetoacetate hydrolase [halophilic archaeon]
MKYYRLIDGCESRLAAASTNTVYDLTSARSNVQSFRDLVQAAVAVGEDIDAVAERMVSNAEQIDLGEQIIDVPVNAEEIWAAGVTYRVSEEARQSESEMPDVYQQVYDGDRPEIFFKATPSRTVGPGSAVGVRSDSGWDVPEPELAAVLYDGDIVGYTIGNDVSSRSIEGENPLYLPQAKVYDRCCSIGPCIASPETVGDPHDLSISMTIDRDGETVFEGETETSKMVTECEELAAAYTRSNPTPELAVLLTGTSIVPKDEFTLTEGDEVGIEIEGIGTLQNGVTTV